MAKEQIIDDVLDDRRLPGRENYSVNEWIGMYLGQLGMDYARDALRELLSEYGYTGNSPVVLFGVYDFLAPDSEEAILHGIRAYELSGHDIEQVAMLKNPGRLVSYIIDVTDEIETLTALQEKIFRASVIRPGYSGLGSLGIRYPSVEETSAAPSIVELGLEINKRLAHIDLSDTQQRESLGFEKWGELYLLRKNALERIVLAQQHLTGDSEETLDILATYDNLAGTADVRGLDYDVLDRFMRRKLQLDKPSRGGEVPDSLKADAYYDDRLRFWGSISPEQEWRMRHFGRRKKSWGQDQEYRKQSEERGEQEREELDEDYRRMIEDPWAFHSEQLALLGLTKEMSYAEARKVFRIRIREHSSAFNTLFNTSLEYAASQKAAEAVLSAWEVVSALYRAKESAGATTAA